MCVLLVGVHVCADVSLLVGVHVWAVEDQLGNVYARMNGVLGMIYFSVTHYAVFLILMSKYTTRT